MSPVLLLLLSALLTLSYTLPQGLQNQQDCSSFQSQGYFCVPYFLCNDAGYISTDGENIFDPRASPFPQTEHEQKLVARCDQTINVCCRRSDTGESESNVKPKAKPSCGLRNEDGVGIPAAASPQLDSSSARQERGDSEFGEWPHVCAIVIMEAVGGTKRGTYTCAGALISKEFVLTGAHCVNEASKKDQVINVRCGDWDLKNKNEEFPYQRRTVAEVIIHPDFNEKNFKNNFAILVTESDFDFDGAKHISPICLPRPGQRFNRQNCVSNGWGKDKLGYRGKFQTRLKEIHLPLVNHQECETRLRKTRLGTFFELDDSFICAGGERGIDTCKGDGGAPLICRHDESDSWVQTGIVSWGIGCGEDIPAVYANVAKATCWIDREVTCYLHASSAATFSAAVSNNDVPSYFGFEPEDCPGQYAIENCII